MSDKKDVLEFPLKQLDPPSAIRLMMQAATKTVVVEASGDYLVAFETNEERLNDLCEKLEAYVEDAIEAAQPQTDISEPTEVLHSQEVENHDVHFVPSEDDPIHQIVVDAVVYIKSCNEPVLKADGFMPTYCTKQWAHVTPIHEDEFGNEAAR